MNDTPPPKKRAANPLTKDSGRKNRKSFNNALANYHDAQKSKEPEWKLAWEYWSGDDEWRLEHDGSEGLAVIYLAEYRHPAVGLRVQWAAPEIEFPNLEEAMFFGYAAVQLLNKLRRERR